MTAEKRQEVISKFEAGQYKVLVCTNLLARGYDEKKVTLVVNVELPKKENGDLDVHNYLHRVGRAGRFARLGLAVTLITNKNEEEQIKQIADHYKINIQ